MVYLNIEMGGCDGLNGKRSVYKEIKGGKRD
jgi:hypothetical protein